MVLMPFYYTLIEPSVLDVLRADVSVELSAQYGAPRPGVSCVQGLPGDVEVLPWAQKVSCHRVQIVLTVLDPVIVVIAAGESLSAPVIAAAGLPEIIQSEGFGLNIDALSTWRCWHSVWWSPPWLGCSCRRPPWCLFLPPCPGDRLGLTSSSSSARSSWGAELRTTLSPFCRTTWFFFIEMHVTCHGKVLRNTSEDLLEVRTRSGWSKLKLFCEIYFYSVHLTSINFLNMARNWGGPESSEFCYPNVLLS